MAVIGASFLSGLTGGSLKDYRHASYTFRSNGYENAPKYKYLFYVNFVLNPNVDIDTDLTTLSYLVKSVDLPKFDPDVQEFNQYNRKVLVQTKIKYQPVTIKFHDDNANTARGFWENYFRFYVDDANHSSNDMKMDDKYVSPPLVNLWGIRSGLQSTFFDSIEIYSMAGGTASKITLYNPMVDNFAHDSHDYAEGSSLMEHTMQIRYTGVRYENGYWSGIPGFADPRYYDTTPSDLSGVNAGQIIDPTTGVAFAPGEIFSSMTIGDQAATASVQLSVSLRNPEVGVGLSATQMSSIARAQAQGPGSQFTFPTADEQARVFNVAQRADETNKHSAITDGVSLNTPTGIGVAFPQNSWQQSLSNKGYSPQQITGADSYVSAVDGSGLINKETNVQLMAEKFINDKAATIQGTPSILPTYGINVAAKPTLDFSNPVTPSSPVYNSDSWQQQLAAKGYTAAEIQKARTQLTNVRVAPGADLGAIAESYIGIAKTGN